MIKISSIIRNIIFIALIISLFSGILCFIFYSLEKNNILNNYGEAAYSIASTVETTLDLDKIVYYRDSMLMDDDYADIVKKLDLIKYRTGLRYLYVNSWNNSNDRIEIYDATEPGDGIEDSVLGRHLLGDRIESNEHFFNLVAGSENLVKWHEDNNIYGHTVCAYYPIKDSEGNNIALVGADFEVEKIVHLSKLVLLFSIAVQILVILVAVIVLIFINKYISSPLKKLSTATKHFVNSKHDEINIVPIKLEAKLPKDSNIKILANSIYRMMLDVRQYSENIQKIIAEKKQISAELNIATKIQKSLIPHIFPAFPELKEIDIYATMDPAQKVGGDFYDFFLMGKDKLAFIIADVSGKGIAAALFMVIAKTLIKNQAASCNDPRVIIENVNKQMCEGNSSGMFITAFFGILDLKTGEVQYVNAGHMNPIAKIGDENFKELKLNKQFVIAGMPSVKFKIDTINLSPGNVLFMYTDGISESKNENNSYFGKDNLVSILDSMDPKANLEQMSYFVKSKIKEFTNGAEQIDDITMLIIKYNGSIK